MKALVVGGNGFIGSRLITRMLAADDQVAVLDTGAARSDFDWSRVDYRQGSLTDVALLDSALEGVDVVYHCASSTVPSSSNLNPVGDIEQNLVGAVHLLEAMRHRGKRRIVYLSSGGTVYGNPSVVPVSEDHPLNPISSYGVVKVAIEKYLLMYEALHGIEPVIVRPSNPYGPGQRPTGVQGLIASFLGKVLSGEPLTVWGDGEVVRDYLYIDDLVEFLWLAGTRPVPGTYNVGSGEGQSVNQIIDAISRSIGRTPDIVRMENRSFDVRRIVLDISRARAVFAWAPSVGLDEGISAARVWIEDYLARAKPARFSH